MALLNCPECEQKISDKAEACPSCGYPISLALKEKSEPLSLELPPGFVGYIDCTSCEKPFDGNHESCPHCGAVNTLYAEALLRYGEEKRPSPNEVKCPNCSSTKHHSGDRGISVTGAVAGGVFYLEVPDCFLVG